MGGAWPDGGVARVGAGGDRLTSTRIVFLRTLEPRVAKLVPVALGSCFRRSTDQRRKRIVPPITRGSLSVPRIRPLLPAWIVRFWI